MSNQEGTGSAGAGDGLERTLTNTMGMLDNLISQVRSDLKSCQEPKAQALFETTAEVLLGLRRAFDDYKRTGEEAWPRGEQEGRQ